jgi:hypothetical protein
MVERDIGPPEVAFFSSMVEPVRERLMTVMVGGFLVLFISRKWQVMYQSQPASRAVPGNWRVSGAMLVDRMGQF